MLTHPCSVCLSSACLMVVVPCIRTPRGPAWDSAADLLVGLAKLLPLDISQDMCL